MSRMRLSDIRKLVEQLSGGGGGGSTLAALSDVDVSNVNTDGQPLVWDAIDGKWTPGSIVEPAGAFTVGSSVNANSTDAPGISNTLGVPALLQVIATIVVPDGVSQAGVILMVGGNIRVREDRRIQSVDTVSLSTVVPAGASYRVSQSLNGSASISIDQAKLIPLSLA
jgi:predicted ribosomally synthesized peptide with SipW-like signal peptide